MTTNFGPKNCGILGCLLALGLFSILLPWVAAADQGHVPASGQSTSATAQADNYEGIAVMPGSYVIAPDDILDISVQGFDEFTRTVTVLPDGTFNFVGAGTVKAAGRTIDAIQQELDRRLVGQIRHPQVIISVKETHPRKISVLGAVQTEGLIDFQPGMRLLDAIANSGGLKQSPEMSAGTLITDHGTHSTSVDMTKLMVDKDMALNWPLSPGDLVLISPRDPEAAQIQVNGQVAKPGSYPVMAHGATIVSILNAAGGATDKAVLTHVQLVHDGVTRVINLHPLLFNIDDPVGATHVVAGDIINVPLNNNRIAVVGEVRVPQIYTIPDGEKWTVFTALTACGGPAEDGDKKKVGLVRRQPNGQMKLTEINTENLTRGKENAVDPLLQPGDILVVPKRNAGFNGWQALQTGLGTLFGLDALSHL